MTISQVSSSTSSNDGAAGSSFTLNPAAAGDLVVVGIFSNGPQPSTPTAAWTVLTVTGTVDLAVYVYVLQAGDISGGQATFSFGTANVPRGVAVGFRSTDGFMDLDSFGFGTIGNSISPPAPSNVSCVDASDFQVEVIMGYAISGNLPIGAPSGWSSETCYGDTSSFVGNYGTIVAWSGPVGGLTAYGAAPAASGADGGSYYCYVLPLTICQAVTPFAPQLVSPVANSYVDLVANPTFTWTYESSDGSSQSAFAFRRKIGAGSYNYYSAAANNFTSTSPVWNASNVTSWPFNGSLWTDTNTYNWSVACASSFSSTLQGPFATDNTVTAQPGATITSLTPSGTITSSTIVVNWTATFPSGASQTGYQLVIYPSTQTVVTPGSSAGWIYNSGFVSSTATNAVIEGLPNVASMNMYLQITETSGVVSLWSVETLRSEYAEPSIPTVTAAQSADINGIPVVAVTVQTFENLLTAVDGSLETGLGTWTAGSGTGIAQSAGMTSTLSLTPVQATPFTLGTTTSNASNPQNGVTPTVANATTGGNDLLAVVTAYNAGSITFTVGPNGGGWTLLGQNATPTASCPYIGVWMRSSISSVGAGGNYGTWNVSASSGNILATITYLEWVGLGSIDNIITYLPLTTPGALTTTGTLSIAGGGGSGVPIESTELAYIFSTCVATAGGETTAQTPSGWTAAYTSESTTNGMHCDVFTKLAGATEPATTVTYNASVTGYTLAGLLLEPSGTSGINIALDGGYSLKLTGI